MQGDAEAALEAYGEAIRANPNDVSAYNNRGVLQEQMGRFSDAFQDFNMVIALTGGQLAMPYYNVAALKERTGELQAALQNYDEAIRVDPRSAAAYNNRGCLKRRLKDFGGARRDLDAAVKIDPKLANPYFHRACLKTMEGDAKGAQKDFEQAIRINPNYAMACQLDVMS